MATFAVIENGLVSNVIVADTLEIAQSVVSGLCLEYTPENALGIGDKIDAKQIAALEKAKAKQEADKAKAETKAEADRVKAIETENERLRQAEADRVAAAQASIPKPVTGVFVRVEPN